MDEENREQPIIMPANVSSETNECGAEGEVGSQIVRQAQQPEQNKYGKFKDAESLFQAYNNLEAEFTKKCQKLSQLEKETQKTQGETLEQFLSRNEEAKFFSQELAQVAGDGESGNFAEAWAKLITKHIASGDAGDPIVSHYVLSNNGLKEKIVEDYLNALNNNKPPIIISSQSGQRVSSVAPDTPTSLAEAKKLVEKMFS